MSVTTRFGTGSAQLKILYEPYAFTNIQSRLSRFVIKIQPEFSSWIAGYFFTNMFKVTFSLPWWVSYVGGGVFVYFIYVLLSLLYLKKIIFLPWRFLRFPNLWTVFTDKSFDEIHDWCNDHCKGNWAAKDLGSYVIIYFNRKSDVAMFMLLD